MDKTLLPPNGKTSELPEFPPRLKSEALLGPHKELVIVHHDREYRLRLTQNDRLILTA